jgi:hypothetical protein
VITTISSAMIHMMVAHHREPKDFMFFIALEWLIRHPP